MLTSRHFEISQLKAALILISLSTAFLLCACSGAKEKAESAASDTTSAVTSAVKKAVSGGDFEGTIALQMTNASQKPIDMTYFVKGERARIEMQLPGMPAESSVMLWDRPNGKMTMLMPSQKVYMTMDTKKMGEEVKSMQKKEAGETKFPKLTATGKSETIAGHTCEHYLMGDKQEIDMCIAKGLGYFGMGNRMGGIAALKDFALNPQMLAEAAAHPEWVKMLEGGAFPLKMTVSGEGKPAMTMETTKIEPKKLDDALFTVPADYKEMKLPGMPGSSAR